MLEDLISDFGGSLIGHRVMLNQANREIAKTLLEAGADLVVTDTDDQAVLHLQSEFPAIAHWLDFNDVSAVYFTIFVAVHPDLPVPERAYRYDTWGTRL